MTITRADQLPDVWHGNVAQFNLFDDDSVIYYDVDTMMWSGTQIAYDDERGDWVDVRELSQQEATFLAILRQLIVCR